MGTTLENSDFTQPGRMAGVWRALDASANRAGEALRVIEDVVRFVFSDLHLTQLAKDLRHDLTAVLARDSLRPRLFVRDLPGDVGVDAVAVAALPRGSADDMLAANAARGSQALRSLQECAAIVAPATAGQFEKLRYRLYTLERAARGTARAQERLQGISLCVLIDGRADERVFDRMLESLLEAGVRMIQIRDKQIGVPTLVLRTQQALAIARRRCPDGSAIVVVNDRVDVAVALGADGSHTGSGDLSTVLTRRVIGPRCLLGRTAHSLAEARTAVIEGADYLGVGPCFPSTTKSFATCAPPEFLSTVAAEVSLPQFAIGGISLEHLDGIASLGIRRVAVASAVVSAVDPARAAVAIMDRLAELAPSMVDRATKPL